MTQSQFVLAQSSMASKKPSTSDTGPVKKLFAVLIKTYFGLEALEANTTSIEIIYEPRRISKATGANAVDTSQEVLSSLVPNSIAHLETIH